LNSFIAVDSNFDPLAPSAPPTDYAAEDFSSMFGFMESMPSPPAANISSEFSFALPVSPEPQDNPQWLILPPFQLGSPPEASASMEDPPVISNGTKKRARQEVDLANIVAFVRRSIPSHRKLAGGEGSEHPRKNQGFQGTCFAFL
jgi:hypothetical protein